jgi:hypothetical protein
VPNPQSRTLEEQPLETPSTDIQAIEQISAELKSHLKEELIDHLSGTLRKQFRIKPKQQIYMYVVWTSLGPLPRWEPGPTTRWAPGTTRLALHGT